MERETMMTETPFNPSFELARELDAKDELAAYRERFVISDPDLLYFDGNSLGRLTKASLERARQAVEEEWGKELIRGWNQGWWDSTSRVGDKIGRLTGAAAGQVIVSDTTSINLFKLALAALGLLPDKRRIVTDTLNFPSDLYILQGCVRLLGGRHEILRIGSQDDDITPDLGALEAAVNGDTALVTLSHVVFKSGYLYDMAAITETAHRRGALVLWDLSHSVGALPIELDKSNVDFAIGCTYKYLNGGPGSPAFLYVNKALQDKVSSPVWGWWGQNQPFAFDLDYIPAGGVQRFQAGTQPMLSLLTMEAALDPLLEAGLDAIRAKSTLLTEYASYLTDTRLAPLGFSLGSPRDPARRGSHISLRHEEGYRINRALIDEMNLIPDFREPDNIRLGFAPLYTTFAEVWEGFERIHRVVTEKRYEHFPMQKLAVT
jgi:kynureninase